MSLRVAYFSPLPPAPTGVADYSAALLPLLSSAVPIDVFAEDPAQVSPKIEVRGELFHINDYARVRAERRYATRIYQMGNSPFHGFLYPTLLGDPGVTILHEFDLHNFYEERTLGHGDAAGYERELAYAGGPHAWRIARRLVAGGRRARPALFERVVDASQAVLVHSEYAAARLRAARPRAVIGKVPMVVDANARRSDPMRTAALRAGWNIPADALVIAQFGRLSPERRPRTLFRAMRRLVEAYPGAICLMVGEVVPPFEAHTLISEYGLSERVRLTGFLPREDFFAAFDLADVAVNLRHPTGGETSAVTTQLLARGVPIVVSDCGSYSELPDGVAVKIGTGRDEESQLVSALDRLCRDPDLRRTQSDRARSYIEREHAPERIVGAYLSAVSKFTKVGIASSALHATSQ